jgi:hypothetical protein
METKLRYMTMEEIKTICSQYDTNISSTHIALENVLTGQRTLFNHRAIWKVTFCNTIWCLEFDDSSFLEISRNPQEEWVYTPAPQSEGLSFNFRPYDHTRTFLHLLVAYEREFMFIQNANIWLRIPCVKRA